MQQQVQYVLQRYMLQKDDIDVIAKQFGDEQQLEPHLVEALVRFLQQERTKRL